MQTFDVSTHADEALAAAQAAVDAGGLVVLPTDTVYGIGADGFNPAAVQRLLDAKLRGRDMPPPVLISDTEVMDALATDIPQAARDLVARYWPGPLTLILPMQPSLRMDLGDTRGTIALRVPDHEVTRALLRRTGPMAVSSANVSGQPSSTNIADALGQLGATVSVYVDAGPTPGETPSTIIDFATTPSGVIVRLGVLSAEDVASIAPSVSARPS